MLTVAMPTLTVENYLKTILQLESPLDNGERSSVSTGEIARALGVAPGTATSMMKALESEGLVRYRPYAGVSLRPKGRNLALHVLRRHRIVELFLVEILGMDWSEVHEEAEHLEHTVSDRVLDRLDHLLGHPTVDPHGDPIPLASGELPRGNLVLLTEKRPGDRCVIARLLDQSVGFLEIAETRRLVPGAEIIVQAHSPELDVVEIRVGSQAITLSIDVAAKIAVRASAQRRRSKT